MLTIGLTGGIASGKSTVSRLLQEQGAAVVDADAIVHQLQAPGAPLLDEIRAAFGPLVIRPDGSLDRAQLGQLIFADPERRKVLEGIVHPRVRAEMWAQVARYRDEGRLAVILDVPLLIETGLYRQVDQVWLVYVDRETQRTRLMLRDKLSAADAERRLAAQMDLEAKRVYADLIIDNRGPLRETKQQVTAAWEQVTGGAF